MNPGPLYPIPAGSNLHRELIFLATVAGRDVWMDPDDMELPYMYVNAHGEWNWTSGNYGGSPLNDFCHNHRLLLL